METSANTTCMWSKKSQHPGAVQVAAGRKRWTQAQIAADKAAEKAEKKKNKIMRKA